MAFNSWDKLSKAQRDYPNPKFALQVAEKALKKQPNNPYLMTWKADLALQQNTAYLTLVHDIMMQAHQQPIMDTELLAYMYRIAIESSRRECAAQDRSVYTVDNIVLGAWQTTAKNMKSKRDRTALWDLLFITAIQEDCWEDARYAIINHSKEGTVDKKQAHYALIIATQLASEQRYVSSGPNDRMATLQLALALKFMKQAYQAPSGDAIAVKDIRDLRFMGELFGRQHRCSDLCELWDKPSKELELVQNRHRSDLIALTTKLLWEQGAWEELEAHCLNAIEDVLSSVHQVRGSNSKFWELCAWRWDLWSGLLAALRARRSQQEIHDILSKQIRKCFPSGIESKDRPLRLTYIKLRDQIGTSMLEDCKTYFQHFSSTPSCFDDLKPIVCRLPTAEFLQFKLFVVKQTQEYITEAQKDQQAVENNWRQRHVVWLKFQYLFTVMLPQHSQKIYHQLLLCAVQGLRIHPEDPDIAFVAVYTLLYIHKIYVEQHERMNPLEYHLNSRILLQATMLARHQVEKDKDKQNRTFSLLAARLHLNLGLGTSAFRLYSHAKCKEMLLDTLSPYILSRISQIHPFEVKGYGGFSADDELARVIGTIQKMERKTEDYLLTDISTFKWDQAINIVGLKRRLNSSLTKHLCMTERRRIARFKGESTDAIPPLDYKTFTHVSDNVDRRVFPDFEMPSKPAQLLELVMCGHLPDVRWLFEDGLHRDLACQLLYHERQIKNFSAVAFANRTNEGGRRYLGHVRPEEVLLSKIWPHITRLTTATHFGTRQSTAGPESLPLLKQMLRVRLAFEKLRMPGITTLAPEDEPTMFHENMLMWCYGILEVCLALVKLTDLLNEKVMKSKVKPNPIKEGLPTNFVEEVKEENSVLYATVRDVAESYINLLKKRGVVAIKAQVRWGHTGELLKHLLSDDDVEYYAKEYVASALEAWNGVLKVKLK